MKVEVLIILYIFLLSKLVLGTEKSQLEQTLDKQNIQYSISKEVIRISNSGSLNLEIILENIDINQIIQLPDLQQLNAKIKLKNVNIHVVSDSLYSLALINSTSQIQNMEINEVSLNNVRTNISLISLQLSSCINCSIQNISFVNTVSSSAFFFFIQPLNFQMSKFQSDDFSILFSHLPVIQIFGNADKVVIQDFLVPSSQLNQVDNELSQLNIIVDYNNEQRSFFQIKTNIIIKPKDDNEKPNEFINQLLSNAEEYPMKLKNIELNLFNKNIRFLEVLGNQFQFISISGSKFVNNKALVNGGSIYQQFGYIYVDSTVFDSCSSNQFGGAIFASGIKLFDDTLIKNCTSKIGGGIFTSQDAKSVIQSKFENNKAYIAKPDVFYCFNDITGKNGICSIFEIDQILEYNSQLYGTSFYMKQNKLTYNDPGVPPRIVTEGEIQYGAIQIIRFQVKSLHNNVDVKNFQEDQSLGNLYNYLADRFRPYFYSLDIPNITYPYLISTYSSDLQCDTTNILLDLDFFGTYENIERINGCYKLKSECSNGSIQFNSIFNQQVYVNCQYCGVGMLNYGVSNNCTVCNPQLYDFCYANVSSIRNGTWRNELSTNEGTIYSCNLSPSNCYSESREGVGNSLCAEGYINEQCLTCDLNGKVWIDNYGETGQFQCAKCSSLSNNTVYFILSICFQLVLFVFTLYSNQRRMRNQVLRIYLSKLNIIYIGTSFIRQSQTAVYIKILLFNFQIYLTAYFFINFNQNNDSVDSNIFSFFSPFQSSGKYSYDCFLNSIFPNQESIGFFQLKLALFAPLILFCIVVITKSLINWCRKKRFITLIYLSVHCYSYLILFVFQQSNLLYSISSLKCLKLTNEKSYLLLDRNIECNNEIKVNEIRVFGIISIVLYTIITPLILFSLLYRQRKNLDKIRVIQLYGFFFDEYKRKYYYWQFIKILLTALLTILLQQIKTHVFLAVLIYLCLLSVYSVTVALLKPFQTVNLNKIELISSVLSILYLLASISLQISHEQQQNYENNLGSIVISSILYYFVLTLLSIFYVSMTVLIIFSFFQNSLQSLQTYRIFQYFARKFPNILQKLYSKRLRDNFKLLRKKVWQMNNSGVSNILQELESCLSQENNQLLSIKEPEYQNEEHNINKS